MIPIRIRLLTTAFAAVTAGTAFADHHANPVHNTPHAIIQHQHQMHGSWNPPAHTHGGFSSGNQGNGNWHTPSTTNNGEQSKPQGPSSSHWLILHPEHNQHQWHEKATGGFSTGTKPTTTGGATTGGTSTVTKPANTSSGITWGKIPTSTSGTYANNHKSNTSGNSNSGQQSQSSSSNNSNSQNVKALLGRAIKELAAADMAVRVNATKNAAEDIQIAIHMIEQAAKLQHQHGGSQASNAAFGGTMSAANQSNHHQSMHALMRELAAILHQVREGNVDRAERDIHRSRQMIERYLQHGRLV